MKKFWVFVSAGCIAAAALALWWQRNDAAFVIATVGALAWFLSYRAGIKELLAEDERSDTESESNKPNEE